MYNDTITLFIRKEGEDGDTWFPRVLRGVHLNADRAAIVSQYGAESADAAQLHIQYTETNGEKTVAGKTWVPPKEWEKLTDKTGVLTFTPGNRFDFFWAGDWGNETTIHDADYAVGATSGFYNYMNKNFDFVFAITSVGGPYSLIPHFEILGK